ncbi:MAG: division/cell wall cluster transcriptional repressor MraZ [Anaerolineae bacterium]|nr:MAG: division/cell wall cluster transcriptional repressor MraZ [Anaerolineae bacterium]
MFLGQYQHNLDDKGRLTVPARFREGMEAGAYLLQGFDKNLMVLPAAAFEAMVRQVNQMNLVDPHARELKRLLFSTAEKVEPDKNGRILVPQFLRDLVALKADATLVGVGDYFEIWPPEDWKRQFARLQDAEANTERFIGLQLNAEQA